MPDAPATTLGRYRLLNRINVGGMAEVFRAKAVGDAGFEKVVALKCILPHLASDRDFVGMFIDEARTVAQLSHGNICQILEFGQADGTYFIALELVEGRDLKRIMEYYRLRGRPMPLPIALYIICRVCDALDYAHNCRTNDGTPLDIVHRDVSPQNVLISWDGEVKLIDFGIAKAAHRLTHTQAGMVKGKFSYISPEQLAGRGATRRSDIFAVGAVLYELLTNTRLFKGETDMATVELVKNAEIAPPTTVSSGLPRQLDGIVLKALARDPKDRYRSAGELLVDLETVAAITANTCNGQKVARWMNEVFGAERALAEEKDRLSDMQRAPTESVVLLHQRKEPSGRPVLEPPTRPVPLVVAGELESPTRSSLIDRPKRPALEVVNPTEGPTLSSLVDRPTDAAATRPSLMERTTEAPTRPAPLVIVPMPEAKPPATRAETPLVVDDSPEGPTRPVPIVTSRPSHADPLVVVSLPTPIAPVPLGEATGTPVLRPNTEAGTQRGRKRWILLGGLAGLLFVGGISALLWPRPDRVEHPGATASPDARLSVLTSGMDQGPNKPTTRDRGPSTDAQTRLTPIKRPVRPRARLDAALRTPAARDGGAHATASAADGASLTAEGLLLITSRPPAQVWVDGKDTGRQTPIAASTPLRLTVGEHRIWLQVGEQTYEFLVRIVAGQTTKLTKTLPVGR
jgi:eukaryotic-like serine/threonine-protein kinase